MKHGLKIAPENRKDKQGLPIVANVPVFADIRFSGSRLWYFTGYRINMAAWNFAKEEMRKNTSGKEGVNSVQYNIINSRLTDIRAAVSTLFESENPDKSTITAKLNEVCQKGVKPVSLEYEFYPMFKTYSENAKLSINKLAHVKTTLTHLQNFDNKLIFKNITVETLKAFEKFLLLDKKAPKGINTVHSIMKNFRAFWNDSRKRFEENGKTLHYPFQNYKIPTEVYGNPLYITKDERDLLFSYNFEVERLAKVRDIFCFQCLCGARVGDLVKFTKSNVIDSVLNYIPGKTKNEKTTTVKVPLNKQALQIISHYDLPDKRLLPFISDIKYNVYIKEVFEVAGLTRSVTRPNPTTRQPEAVRLCDIASSHMGRRSFVGLLYGNVDSGIIASMSGHVPASKAFTRYFAVSEELKRQATDNL